MRSADPILARQVALRIVRALRGAGHTALLAGGCVRDLLLGLRPTDYDVATSATPDRIRDLFPRTHSVGEAFGVMLVAEGGAVVEVATFRADGDYSDRRRPDKVEFSDAQRDGARRDFTINALFLDPLPDVPQPALPGGPAITDAAHGAGRVIDYVRGLPDLRARVLRAVGDPTARLREDHLRALRAVRFSARLGFTIDPATRDAVAREASALEGVSRERIGDELRRMMAHPSRAQAAQCLHDLGLAAPVLHTAAAPPASGLRVLGALEPALGHGPPGAPAISFACALAAWAIDLGLAAAEGPAPLLTAWRSALCLSNDERDELKGTLAVFFALQAGWPASRIAAQKRLAASPHFPTALLLLQAVNANAAASVRNRFAELEQIGPGIGPPPLVTGDDLIAAGFRPGPAFKALLERLYDEQLEGRVKNTPDGVELARRLGV